MKNFDIKNKYIRFFAVVISIFCILFIIYVSEKNKNLEVFNTENNEAKEEYKILLENLFDDRNKYILQENSEKLKALYETEKKYGLWAYEHEIKKMKYLKNWSQKQGVKFIDIKTKVKIKKMREKETDLYGVICTVSTEYKYSYENQKDVVNVFRIGTYHYLNVKSIDNQYVIVKEWYTDPFADSLNLDNINSDQIRSYILVQQKQDVLLKLEQRKAIDYAHRYCGAAADEEYEFKFNPSYKDFNPDGGDCANFASQIMYESTRFKKNSIWNYSSGDATKAWVNAQAFKNYILNSGRGSLIDKGTYNEIYKISYKLVPGDFVAYEKDGRITHISTVTGVDSKGYPLVTCHNTDRLLVPWDLGWSNKSIKFHLIKVHY